MLAAFPVPSNRLIRSTDNTLDLESQFDVALNAFYQDLLVFNPEKTVTPNDPTDPKPDPGTDPVPEPGTIFLFGTGILVLAAIRRIQAVL